MKYADTRELSKVANEEVYEKAESRISDSGI